MAAAPTAILDRLVGNKAGPGTRVYAMTGTNPTPMSVVTACAQSAIERALAVYWIDGGAPRNLSMPTLEPAPVLFSARFVELGATLFRLLTNNMLAPDLVTSFSERTNLQVLAELLLQAGDPSTAGYLFTRSLISCGDV